MVRTGKRHSPQYDHIHSLAMPGSSFQLTIRHVLVPEGGRKEEGGNGSAALVHELLPTRPAAGFLGIAES